ncbi:MAG: mechanosensitive ion channel family protein [Lentisphaeria bacterium]|nr:mechanosensitive ion channel family protein [Candidatus Neomarinimicrobiota bacterium]MCF7842287.1 mechanosensitive ion channel family protein [Lentisphaeria bacterium]
MDILTFDISELLIVKYVLLGLVLIVILAALRKGLGLTRLRPVNRDRLNRALPLIEALVGLLFLMAAIHAIFKDQPTYLMILFSALMLMVIWSFWFAIQDFVSGLILKWEDTYMVGDSLSVDGTSGKILKIGYRSLEIETPEGQRVKMPYAKLARSQVIKADVDESVWTHTFQIELPVNISPDEAARWIRLTAANHIWSAVNRSPAVTWLGAVEDSGHNRYEVTVYALDPSRRNAIEMAIKTAQYGELNTH